MKNYKYDGSRSFRLKSFDCGDTGEFRDRHETIDEFVKNLEKINELQQKMFAEQKEGIIFVFQAMDAAGKDGAVRAVLSCLSPQGVSEHSFKVPSAEENRHDYLWRFWSAIPEKGSISIFNRSYYEDVLVQKIHEIYKKNKFADRIDLDTMVDKRYEQIRNFEKYLWENSIRVVKIFLNVSKDEQAKRFISRIDTQKKNWKFSSGDIDERAYWDEYMEAYETAINRTARKNTPWYVVPADHKWYARLVISRIVLNELENMNPQWPVLSEEEMAKLQSYREKLVGESEDIQPADDITDDGKKIKPADTAIAIALKADRQAVSEKKFRKQLEKSVFENFSERFGVSNETEEKLGMIYLNYEEAEAKAAMEELAALKEKYDEEKAPIAEELKGCGKEGRKLYEHYKKASRKERNAFEDEWNICYNRYEEELKQLMTAYEMAVGAGNVSPEEALAAYETGVGAAFKNHRAETAALREAAEQKLETIADEFFTIGMAFHKEEAEEAAPAEENTEPETIAAEEAPAEETIAEEITEAETAEEPIDKAEEENTEA